MTEEYSTGSSGGRTAGRAADRFRFGRADGPGLVTRFPGMVYQCRNARDWPMEFVSEGALELTGHAPDEFLSEEGVVFADLIREGDRERVWAEVQEAVDENRPFELEYRIRNAGGEEHWVRELGHPVWAEDGELLGLEGYIFDITGQKERSEELRRTLDLLHTLTDQSLFGVYVIKDGVFLYVNERLAEIFGYAREEIVGRLSPSDLASEPDRARIADNIARRLSGDVAELNYVFRGRCKDGSEIDIEVHGARVQYGGGWAISGVLLDFTHRRELEDQLGAAQKREALAELTATVTHDFNNFLTAILGSVDLAVSDLPDGSPARPQLELAMGTIERARTLTLQLLSFSRTLPSTLRTFDLNGVVGEMGLLLEQLVGSPVQLAMDLSPEPLPVRADWSKLEQVIMNLVVNARDAMPLGGSVRIRTLRTPGEDAEIGRAEVELVDTGEGIAEEDLERVFEPFYTTKKMGTGLGLPMVRRILEEAGGGISVSSRSGEGTTFRLWMPLVPEAADEPTVATEPRAPKVSPEPGPAQEPRSILVVEDDDSVRQVMKSALARAGYEVTAVRSAAAALETVEGWEDGPSLAIIDYSLPDRDGVDLARELRTVWPASAFMLSSGFVSSELVGAEFELDGTAFLAKPFSVDGLLTAVRAVLRERGDGPPAT